MLGRVLRCGAISSSAYAAERAVWPIVAARGLWPDWRAMHADRGMHREMWFHAIRAYNLAPGASLAEQILAERAIYVGMRSREEFAAARGLFDCVIWIDAGRRLPIEDPSSMELEQCDADRVLDNNGTEADLARGVAALALALRAHE
ncbi:hypothetical protein [Chachezhania antarctica]|uniref:hypothetical protein n=1 Tax=Chachezhania antarctica TaxID=2340860 RepID=UPI000EB47588|nr:hypothetical protein [Chachezhania antarctica]